jgi:ATP/maltotriose-dependent transcriptional regulator MalT
VKGRLEDAARNAEAITELALLMETDRHRRIAMTIRSTIEVVRGDVYAAVRFAEQGLGDPEKDDWHSGVARAALAQALLEIGEPERSREQLLSAEGTPRLPQIPIWEAWCYLLLTRAELGRGEVDQADRYAGAAEELARSYPTIALCGTAARARALVLLARGEAAAAGERAAEAIACAERIGSPIAAGEARILLGRALEAAGDRAGAIKELESAHGELGSRGALRYQDEAARALRKLGRAVPRRSEGTGKGALRGLTKREVEVLSLVGRGRTNRQIAAELYLSVRTVDRHVSRIFDKLGVSSRAAAAFLFERSRQAT